jgi:anion-transporting  ArsA/GET3 family ATPase
MTYYDSIDEMPVYNWFKCIEDKRYQFCMKNVKHFKNSMLNKARTAFSKIYAEYVDTFGVSEALQEIIYLENEIMCLRIDLAITQDRFLETLIEIKQIELSEKLKEKPAKTNFAKVAIEKYLGFRLNDREVTVREYYEYLNVIKAEASNG